MLDYALSTSGSSTGNNWQIFVASIYFVFVPGALVVLYLLVRLAKVVTRQCRPGLTTMEEAREAANRRALLAGHLPRI